VATHAADYGVFELDVAGKAARAGLIWAFEKGWGGMPRNPSLNEGSLFLFLVTERKDERTTYVGKRRGQLAWISLSTFWSFFKDESCSSFFRTRPHKWSKLHFVEVEAHHQIRGERFHMLGSFVQAWADGLVIQAHDAGSGFDAIPFHQAADGAVEGLFIGLHVQVGRARGR